MNDILDPRACIKGIKGKKSHVFKVLKDSTENFTFLSQSQGEVASPIDGCLFFFFPLLSLSPIFFSCVCLNGKLVP